jgi:hypothetical protein
LDFVPKLKEQAAETERVISVATGAVQTAS